MPELNMEKCYHLPAQLLEPLEISSLPEDWLSLLIAQIQPDVTNQKHLLDYYTRQIAPTYTHYLELTKNLQIIFIYASSTNANPLIVTQMPKEPDELHCTAGFHNRVQYVLQLLHSPLTFDELTALYRKDIVDRAARKFTHDIHTHNLYFVIARNTGFGVLSINEQDAYLYTDHEEIIYDNILLSFKSEYTFFKILTDCYQRIKSKAEDFGYLGNKSDSGGYTYDEYNKICDFMRRIFPSLNLTNCLVLTSESVVIDINWFYIKQLLLHELIKKEYFILSPKETSVLFDCDTSLSKVQEEEDSKEAILHQIKIFINSFLIRNVTDNESFHLYQEMFSYIKYFFEIDDPEIYNNIDYLSLSTHVKTKYQIDFLLKNSPPESHLEIISTLNQDAIELYILNIYDLTNLIVDSSDAIGVSIINKFSRATLLSFINNYTDFMYFINTTLNSKNKKYFSDVLVSELVAARINNLEDLKYIINQRCSDSTIEKILILLGSKRLKLIITDYDSLISLIKRPSALRAFLYLINPINLKNYITDSYALYNLLIKTPAEQHKSIISYVNLNEIPIKLKNYPDLAFVLENYPHDSCMELIRSLDCPTLKILLDNHKNIITLLSSKIIHDNFKKIILQKLFTINPLDIISNITDLTRILNDQLIDSDWKLFLLRLIPGTDLIKLITNYRDITTILSLFFINDECKQYLFNLIKPELHKVITTTDQLKNILNDHRITLYHKIAIIDSLTYNLTSYIINTFADLLSLFATFFMEDQCKIKILELLECTKLSVLIRSQPLHQLQALRECLFNDEQKIIFDTICSRSIRTTTLLVKRPREVETGSPETHDTDVVQTASYTKLRIG